MKRLVPAVAALGLISLVGAGCNPLQSAKDKVAEEVGNKIVENAIEKAIEKDSGKKVNVDLGNKGVTLQGENGQAMAFGENVTFPDTFPSDVPKYTSGKMSAVTSNPEEKEAGYTLMTSQPAGVVVAWYKSEAERLGWKLKTTYATEQITIISYEKKSGEITAKLNISVSAGSNGGETSVIVGWNGK